jgi:hypothetical protein
MLARDEVRGNSRGIDGWLKASSKKLRADAEGDH